jgi:DNA (cytosine-5)-methyltransferase 1
MGFPEDWTVAHYEPVNGSDSEVDSLRYHALGNAVTPPVAEWFAEKISAYLHANISSKDEYILTA